MAEVKRVCVLTGASGRLGQAFIKAYASRYLIVGVYNKHAFENNAVHSTRVDLSKPDEIVALCSNVMEWYGKIDLLINAAVYSRWRKPLDPDALRDIEHAFNVNVVAPLRLAIGFADSFWSRDKQENLKENRNIINVSSTAGVRVYPNASQMIYSATKAALNFSSFHLANEFQAIGVRVNSVAPTSFPSAVSTESVLETMIVLDEFKETGRCAIIDKK